MIFFFVPRSTESGHLEKVKRGEETTNFAQNFAQAQNLVHCCGIGCNKVGSHFKGNS